MRKVCISLILVTIIILSAIVLIVGGSGSAQTTTEYLRIHIRADSNSEEDQAVKYKVKSAVVEYLTPYIAECDTFEKAKTLLSERLDEIEEVADGVLKLSDFTYTAKARVSTEEFPTRVYDGVTLDSGFYQALILDLGSGSGDNWWCVVYPPLCFVGNDSGYKYKSKIYEIINNFFKKEDNNNK